MRLIILSTQKSAGWLLFIIVACLAVPSLNAGSMSFTGTVVTEKDSSGIPNLTVSLTPPAAAKQAKKVTTTDNQGRFTFNELESSQYFLEVFQGLTVLYSEVVNVPQQNSKEIRLSPR